LLQALHLIQKIFECTSHLCGEPHVVYDHFYKQCLPYIEPIKDHLTLLGLIRDRQKLADFYAMCDVFAQPSRTDNMPLTEIEAMLCGTPVVVSDIPGARVVVQVTGFGRLAPAGQPGALAEVLCHVMQNREQYTPTRAAVRKIFDTDKTLDQYQSLLEGLIPSSKRQPALPARSTPPVTGSLSETQPRRWRSYAIVAMAFNGKH
jgi:glycosyltransferase involved in cell wall biosynthesis